MVISPLSTRLIKPNFSIEWSHVRVLFSDFWVTYLSSTYLIRWSITKEIVHLSCCRSWLLVSVAFFLIYPPLSTSHLRTGIPWKEDCGQLFLNWYHFWDLLSSAITSYRYCFHICAVSKIFLGSLLLGEIWLPVIPLRTESSHEVCYGLKMMDIFSKLMRCGCPWTLIIIQSPLEHYLYLLINSALQLSTTKFWICKTIIMYLNTVNQYY